MRKTTYVNANSDIVTETSLAFDIDYLFLIKLFMYEPILISSKIM